jgi:hypothetical protein
MHVVVVDRGKGGRPRPEEAVEYGKPSAHLEVGFEHPSIGTRSDILMPPPCVEVPAGGNALKQQLGPLGWWRKAHHRIEDYLPRVSGFEWGGGSAEFRFEL